MGNSISLVLHLINKLDCFFSLKQMHSLDHSLDIEVHHSPTALAMPQTKHIKDILAKKKYA